MERYTFGAAMAHVEQNRNKILYVEGVPGVAGLTHQDGNFALITPEGRTSVDPTLFMIAATSGATFVEQPTAQLDSSWDSIFREFGSYSEPVRRLVSKIRTDILNDIN